MPFIYDINDVAQNASYELKSLDTHLTDLGRLPMIIRLQNEALVQPLSEPESIMLNMLVREHPGADATNYVACRFSAGAHQYDLDYLSSLESTKNPVDRIREAVIVPSSVDEKTVTSAKETNAAAWPFYENDSEGDDVWLGKNGMLI